MPLLHWQHRFEQWLSQNYSQDDKAHDLAHFRRVWRTASRLMANSAADALVVLTASYFHDVVNLPKDHPQRAQASSLAAKETLQILAAYFPDYPTIYYQPVAHAIEAHSFSAGVMPRTLEAKIVQDADRLESLGAIGLARVFYVSGALGHGLFNEEDPLAEGRELDDQRWALDHFQAKLLRLPETMQTEQGRALARHNANFLVQYMAKLRAELNGDFEQPDDGVLARFSQ